MITEDYVSFEIAKLLKEKGFDEATNRYYNAQCHQIRTVSDTFMWHWNNEEFVKGVLMDGAIAIPTLQMAMKWLREERKLNCIIDVSFNQNGNEETEYYFSVWENKPPYELLRESSQTFSIYEEACEAAIKYCLEKLV